MCVYECAVWVTLINLAIASPHGRSKLPKFHAVKLLDFGGTWLLLRTLRSQYESNFTRESITREFALLY